MTERDDDFEFDFFDEPASPEDQTVERPPRRIARPQGPAPGGPPPRGPRIRAATGAAPLLRLVGLIAFAILIVVLLVFWVNSCRDSGKKNSYQRYFEQMGQVAADSQQVGSELRDALTTAGARYAQIDEKLNSLAQQQQQDVTRARELSPPGALRVEQQHAVEALEFRVSGLQGLSAALRQASTARTRTGSVTAFAEQARRLVASDVIWDDRFKAAAVARLQAEGLAGDIKVPDSNFVQFPDFDSTRTAADIINRIFGGTDDGGGLHGTGLVVVRALPSGQELQTDTDNTVVATTDLGFSVTVEDTGDSQEVGVQVTLTIQQNPAPIVKRQTIPVINAGEQKTVIFRNLGQVQFATKTTLKVDVKAVPNEENLDNNSLEFPVIFSLG
ncbi:MAG: CARDB domain-containing protein [Gaiellaceae bacterium]